ncbi:MAG: lysine--tRNA ligase [Gammaproteobacteria bacterium]
MITTEEKLNQIQDQTQDQTQIRKAKLDVVRKEQGAKAFPNDFKRKDLARDLHDTYGVLDNEALESRTISVQIAGRIMARRLMGKASFVQIQDMSGRIQLYVKQETLGEAGYEAFKDLDFGDIIGVQGSLFKTKTAELSVKVESLALLTKALRPLPDKWHGLQDKEACYRQRYLDLIMSEDTQKTFKIRSQVVQFIRNFLSNRGYLEVETPMMHVIPGGASARPFITHHNTLDMDLYLRVAPELYLKRLVVGGFEKVFEINRNFRNEGLSTRHNPEFTMLEFYEAYADYKDLMKLTEVLLRELVEAVLGRAQITYQGQVIDFNKPFDVYSIEESLLAYNPDLTLEQVRDEAFLSQHLKAVGADPAVIKNASLGKLQFELFEQTVEAKIIQPTFITEYPIEVSPLARCNETNPKITDRAELFVMGREIANLFSELNDPEDQAERFKKQVEAKDAGDEEAMHFDADYITALEHGLAPTAGEGIGIDRLVMLLTDSPSIRDVILFPHMRLKTES